VKLQGHITFCSKLLMQQQQSTAVDGGTLGATANECWGRRRAKSLPWANVTDFTTL